MRIPLLLVLLSSLLCVASAQDGTYSCSPRTYSSTSPHYGFKVYLPAGYSGGSATYPLVVFLHGSGERGLGDSTTELAKLDGTGSPTGITSLLAGGADYNAIIICPQATPSAWFWEPYVADLVNWAKSNYRVNPDKVVLTGLSSGGSTTWLAADSYPGLFSAVVPLSGAIAYNDTANGAVNLGQGLRRKQVWAWHDDDDTTVYPSRTANWLNSIVAGSSFASDYCRASKPAWPTSPAPDLTTANTVYWSGSGTTFTWVSGVTSGTQNPRWTDYAIGGHGNWTRPYQVAALWTWMLAQTNVAPTLAAIPATRIEPSASVTLTLAADSATMHPDYLRISVATSNATVVPLTGLVLGGSGSARTLAITPAATSGTATITVTVSDWSRTVSDPGYHSVSQSFVVTVQTAAARIAELEGLLATANASIATLTSNLSSATATVASQSALIATRDALIAQIHTLTNP